MQLRMTRLRKCPIDPKAYLGRCMQVGKNPSTGSEDKARKRKSGRQSQRDQHQKHMCWDIKISFIIPVLHLCGGTAVWLSV